MDKISTEIYWEVESNLKNMKHELDNLNVRETAGYTLIDDLQGQISMSIILSYC